MIFKFLKLLDIEVPKNPKYRIPQQSNHGNVDELLYVHENPPVSNNTNDFAVF
jgi:hypothetical protein